MMRRKTVAQARRNPRNARKMAKAKVRVATRRACMTQVRSSDEALKANRR